MGTRVVVRHRLSDSSQPSDPSQPSHPSQPSATDVLGYLSAIDETHCVIASTKGLVTIELASVIAAKEIPPPPSPVRR